ncbi:MAG: TetR/AcrR family transcriptional regulator [Clostridia bacterium]|nr:TetR/AcrR family transcriptional regulator [Clostridia bacterium]
MRNAEKDEREMAQRREKMLEEGFRLFSERGIESVAMQDVADACGLGIATLYRYFKTKLSLVLAIGTRQWEDYVKVIDAKRTENAVEKMTAAEELSFYLDFYIDLYHNHKDLLCFNQNFNIFVQHEGATQEQLAPYIAALGNIVGLFHMMYEKGKKDGTLRTDMSEDRMFAATSHIMLAVAVRYAQGLIFHADSEDMTRELLLVKQMILREYVTENK